MQQVPTLRSLRRDTCLFESGRPCQLLRVLGSRCWVLALTSTRHLRPRTFLSNLGGVCKRQSGLSFKQSPEWLCGFEPRHPCHNLHALAVAQPAERCTVNAESCGFDSRRPTFSTHGALAKHGLRRATLYRVSAGSNPARPANSYGAVAERLGTGLSLQTTRVRVSSVPPSTTAPEARQARAPAS